ncbi:hypothetical protein EJ357_12455 [Streptomyces cyaneochromogenes]|uniref:DUF308 domain-containing protein n=1 Tax=Streptomyces cyaneochromogenes TaxID=2496836 RepID=A0A3Q9ERB8_9ACTN|nr:hypothetical protein [Streptomyces cyaneochromogenes]AZQ34193.1 hypothetical protein EJ357_12455 [Streptomyces cyaneochromogenes]
MAEHDSDRERREDRDDREPEEQHVPFDEDAAWAAIVAGYGDEPKDPPGAKPFKSVEDLALLESDPDDEEAGDRSEDAKGSRDEQDDKDGKSKEDKPARPLGSSVSFAPGVGAGPRDYSAPEPSEDDFDIDDEGHFVPPEPPPLPAADPTAKFAWLAVVGGPVLLLLAVLFGWDMTWWLATLGIGGFLGGFATLVMRMKTDDDEDDDPGRGAVV